MPFQSLNQQHQSTEGWQCSWLGTVCCQHAAKRGQELSDGCVSCLAIQLQRSILPVTTTVLLTWRHHAATMLSWWARNTVVEGHFTGWMPFSTNRVKGLKATVTFTNNTFIVMTYYTYMQQYITQPSKLKQMKTHFFVPFHTILFIALHGNGPEIQFTPAQLTNVTYWWYTIMQDWWK